jgi:prepilin-type N-terminal cleavage/methylation domain-containing protein
MKYSRRPFTLVELLVTMSIIAVLAGILLPAIRSAMRSAKEGRAKSEINSLITAMKLYESEYDLMPFGYDSTEDSSTAVLDDDEYRIMISFLSQTGDDADKADGNARKLKILSVKKAAEYLDPWKNRYHVIGDVNSDDSIDKDLVIGMDDDGDDLPRSVVVWSAGADKKYDSSDPEAEVNRDNVYSVETNWDKAKGHVIP